MDEAVWDASYYQDVHASSYSEEETGQLREVLFDSGEEDILNEISCIQVLRILITNANTEMAQLQEDLVSLHCELALADDAWYKKCVSTLQQEIKSFDILIPKLKNSIEKGEHEFDLEPAKGMHEMLKVLLKDDPPQENDKVLHESVEENDLDTLKREGREARVGSERTEISSWLMNYEGRQVRDDDDLKLKNQSIEIAYSLDRSNSTKENYYLNRSLTLELPLQAQEHSKPPMETMEFESEDPKQLVAEAKATLEEIIQPEDSVRKEENDSNATLSSLLRVAVLEKRKRKSMKIKVEEADTYHSEDCEKAPSQMQQNTMRSIIIKEEQIEELKQGSVLKPQKSKPKGRVPQTNNSIQLNFNGRIMVQKALSDLAATQEHKDSSKQSLKGRRMKRSKSCSPAKRLHIFLPKLQETVVETMDGSSISDPGEKILNPLSPSFTEEPQIIESILDLNCLSIIELKSIAKALKMSGYAKLKKSQLQEQVKLELNTQRLLNIITSSVKGSHG